MDHVRFEELKSAAEDAKVNGGRVLVEHHDLSELLRVYLYATTPAVAPSIVPVAAIPPQAAAKAAEPAEEDSKPPAKPTVQ